MGLIWVWGEMEKKNVSKRVREQNEVRYDDVQVEAERF
jgi:hypothetical protein